MRQFSLVLAIAFAATVSPAIADIHDPPGNEFGPTRKLGRAMTNLMFGWCEVQDSVGVINQRDGNTAAVGYGLTRGFGRWVFRTGAGVYELVTFPLPLYKASYRPFYRDDIQWIHGGYPEFPPDQKLEGRVRYNRDEHGY